MVGDNGPQLDGWQMPRRCCATWADDLHCDICGNIAKPAALTSIIDTRFEGLGEN